MLTHTNWNTIAALGSAAAAVAAVVGLFLTHHTFKRSQRDRANDTILSQASQSLKTAYEVLTHNGQFIPPQKNRLNWLTSARHILRYKRLKNSLAGTHLLVCDEIEEFWRYRFYIAVEPLENKFGYYDSPGDKTLDAAKATIDPKSALVILAFSDWQEGRVDPLREVRAEDLLLDGHTNLLLKHSAFDKPYRALAAREKEVGP